MRLFDPDPTIKWLFAMTHPDDEISICAWIKRIIDNGAEVWMSWTHSNPEREGEARNAARLLGIPEDRLIFFGAPDGHVVDHIKDLFPKFKSKIEAVRPSRIACGAFEQGHLDHDATNYLVNRSFEGPVLEVPFYHTYANLIQTINRFADSAGEEVLHLEPEEQALKRTLSQHYESQRIGDLLVWYEVWQRIRLRETGLWKSERLRLQTHKDFMKPNLPESLAARVERTAAWHRWIEAIHQVESG